MLLFRDGIFLRRRCNILVVRGENLRQKKGASTKATKSEVVARTANPEVKSSYIHGVNRKPAAYMFDTIAAIWWNSTREFLKQRNFER